MYERENFEDYIKNYIDFYKEIKPEEWTTERLRKQIVLNLQNIKNFGGKYFEKVRCKTIDDVFEQLIKYVTISEEINEAGEEL